MSAAQLGAPVVDYVALVGAAKGPPVPLYSGGIAGGVDLDVSSHLPITDLALISAGVPCPEGFTQVDGDLGNRTYLCVKRGGEDKLSVTEIFTATLLDAGVPGLFDLPGSQRAEAAIMSSLRLLVSPETHGRDLLPLTSEIATHASFLCTACKGGADAVSHPALKQQFTAHSRSIAKGASALVASVRDLVQQRSDEARRRLEESARHLQAAIEALSAYAQCEPCPANVSLVPRPVDTSGLGASTFALYMSRDASKSPIVDVLVLPAAQSGVPPPPQYSVCEPLTFNTSVTSPYESRARICIKRAQRYPEMNVAYRAAILDRHPLTDQADFPLPQALPFFCLPDGVVYHPKERKPHFFTFVLTDALGGRLYANCLVFYERVQIDVDNNVTTAWAPKVLCLISRFPFYTVFSRYLRTLHDTMQVPCEVPLERLLSNLFEVPLPPPGRIAIQLQVGQGTVVFSRPPPTDYPMADYSLLPLFHALDLENVVSFFSLVLAERKVVVQSSHYSLLAPVCEAICALLFPFRWQHVFIPLCPPVLMDFLQAPMPFIIGVKSGAVDISTLAPDVFVVDLDTNQILRNADGNASAAPQSGLPWRGKYRLMESLRHEGCAANLFIRNYTQMDAIDSHPFAEPASPYPGFKSANQSRMEQIREAFLAFFVSLFGEYRDFVRPPTAETLNDYDMDDLERLFDMAGFLRSQMPENRAFVEAFMERQAFARFLEERSEFTDREHEYTFFDTCIEAMKARPMGRGSLASSTTHLPALAPAAPEKPPALPQGGAVLGVSPTHMSGMLQAGQALSLHGAAGLSGPGGSVYRVVRFPLPEMGGLPPGKTYYYGGHISGFERKMFVPPRRHNINMRTLSARPGDGGRVEGHHDDDLGPFPPFGAGRRPSISYRESGDIEEDGGAAVALSPGQPAARKGPELPDAFGSAQTFLRTIFNAWFLVFSTYVPLSPEPDAVFAYANTVLERMEWAGIPADETVFRYLLEACARAGLSRHAKSVLKMLGDAGIAPNATTTGLFVKAVAGEHAGPAVMRLLAQQAPDPQVTPVAAVQRLRSDSVRAVRTASIGAASTGSEGDAQPARAQTPPPPAQPSVTWLSDALGLGSVVIESRQVCSSCQAPVCEEDVLIGWAINRSVFKTICPRCDAAFLPALSWHGVPSLPGYPNVKPTGKCPYLSPEMFLKELDILVSQGDGVEFRKSPARMMADHPTVFWNMHWYFGNAHLPVSSSALRRTVPRASIGGPGSTPGVRGARASIAPATPATPAAATFLHAASPSKTNPHADRISRLSAWWLPQELALNTLRGTMMMHYRVTGARALLQNKPTRRISAVSVLPIGPDEVTERNDAVVQALSECAIALDEKNMRRAMEVFLAARARCPRRDGDGSALLHGRMYTTLLALTTRQSYATEKEFAESYRKELSSLRAGVKEEMREAQDGVPAEAYVAFRSAFEYLRPAFHPPWGVRATGASVCAFSWNAA